jgi:hypothetical protein
VEKRLLAGIQLEVCLSPDNGCVWLETLIPPATTPLMRSWRLHKGALTATQAEDIAAYVRNVAYHSVISRVMCQEVLPLA